jgi:monoamine oxidase
MAAEPSYDAVVVGGGFAGVTAARELAAAGLRTGLLEARDRLGGRTWSSDFGGLPVELGGAWVHWQQPHVWAELTRYGIGIEEDDWRHDAFLAGNPPRRCDADAAFARVRELFTRFAGAEGIAALPRPHDPLHGGQGLDALDALSMEDRLDALDLDDEERGLLTGLLYEIAGSPLDEAGLMPVLRWLALCDWSIDGWYDTNRYRPRGGTRAILDAMLADGRVDVRLATPVARVDTTGDRVRLTTVGGETVDAAAVVVAVPANVWRSIEFTPALPDAHRTASAEGLGKPHQDKVWIRVRGPIGRIFAQLPAPAPLNFFWTYATDGDEQVIFGINANPDLDVTDPVAVERTLRAYVPEIEAVLDVRGQNWAADPYSAGGNTCFRPGQLTRLLADLQRPHGRLSFATADIASGWVGYMDGAIEAGLRAARHAIATARR